ncbi:hypothetical protein [Catenulispora rubra]|uniref:hypothetical protein n=1 Tax=Catenulispora rubra TaxID=280293 RepID=UPI001891F4DF|nr:hypothetical protein [Catenulispora rubra]
MSVLRGRLLSLAAMAATCSAVNSDGNIYSADGNYGANPGSSGWSNVSRSGGAGTMTGTMTNIAAASIN